MIDDERRDRDVHAWIVGQSAARAPDWLRESVRAELADTRQERATASVPEWLASTPMRAAAAVVALAVGAAALGLLAGRGSVGNPSPTTTPAVVPSPSSPPPSASPVPTPPGTVIPAGMFATSKLRPALTLTLPAGWTRSVDQSDLLVLVPPAAPSFRQPDGLTVFESINVYARPRAGQPDGTLAPVEGVGSGASDLATWLSKRPQLTATTPVAETLAGRRAYRLDFQLSPEAGDLCGIPCANLLNSTKGPGAYAMGIEADWKVRAWLLEAPDGSTIMVTIESPTGTPFDATVAEATPVVESIAFAAP
jgi:hypothetical protein